MSKILVVDDAESQRHELKLALENHRYVVIEAKDGADGLDQLMKNPDISLIICDVNMPVMDGITMCSKIHEGGKHPGLPIFMLTTEASKELKEKAKSFGVRAWITKPFDSSKLIAAAQKVIKANQ